MSTTADQLAPAAAAPSPRRPRKPSKRVQAMIDQARREGYEACRMDMGPMRGIGVALAWGVTAIVCFVAGALWS